MINVTANVREIPFGTYVTIKCLNGELKNAICIYGGFTFETGRFLPFEDLNRMQVFLGWNNTKYKNTYLD